VSIEIGGGLGNQLFSLVAGVFISRQIGVPLRVFVNDALSSTNHQGLGLTSFKFFLARSYLIEDIRYGPSQTLRRRKKLNDYLRRFGVGVDLSYKLSGYYSPLVVGDDPNIGSIKAGSYIRGYFQSARYFLAIRGDQDFYNFDLQTKSYWFKNTLQEIAIAKPIAIHVRRGDYLKPENNFIGALSKTYFLDAIKLLKQDSSLANCEVWIFSNDTQMVKKELGEDIQGVVRWVDPPSESSEAESLLLMASAKALVISNSTYSWWSAAIGDPERVIAPSKWFKSADDPDGLMLPNWESVQSYWL